MMKNKMAKTAISLTALLPALAVAHPGHDHGHWMAGVEHMLFGLTFVVAAVAGVKLVSAYKKSKTVQQEEQD